MVITTLSLVSCQSATPYTYTLPDWMKEPIPTIDSPSIPITEEPVSEIQPTSTPNMAIPVGLVKTKSPDNVNDNDLPNIERLVDSSLVKELSQQSNQMWAYPAEVNLSKVVAGSSTNMTLAFHNGYDVPATFHFIIQPETDTVDGYVALKSDIVSPFIKFVVTTMEIDPKTTADVPIQLTIPEGTNFPDKWYFVVGIKTDGAIVAMPSWKFLCTK